MNSQPSPSVWLILGDIFTGAIGGIFALVFAVLIAGGIHSVGENKINIKHETTGRVWFAVVILIFLFLDVLFLGFIFDGSNYSLPSLGRVFAVVGQLLCIWLLLKSVSKNRK